MIFADKLIQLRKKAGWSQEELAEQMQVTRQAVSKWEGAQSVPDLEKLLRLSELFGVTTDYLLKDEIETVEDGTIPEDMPTLHRVTLSEAHAFLARKRESAKVVAMATCFCILSPILLIWLAAYSEANPVLLSENAACAIGMTVLLGLVAVAVALFLLDGRKNAPYAYLEKDSFETEYGVRGMVQERKAQYSPVYTRGSIVGVCLCILAMIPLFVSSIFTEDDIWIVTFLSCTLVVVGVGVYVWIRCGVVWASYERLLEEGEYTREKKKGQSVVSAVSTAYWLIVTAICVGCSALTDRWDRSWILWAVAGILFPVVLLCVHAFTKKEK